MSKKTLAKWAKAIGNLKKSDPKLIDYCNAKPVRYDVSVPFSAVMAYLPLTLIEFHSENL